MAPAFAQFEQEYKDKIKIVTINVDNQTSPENQQYGHFKTSEYIPETLILKNGTVAYKKVGSMSYSDLVDAVKSNN